MPIQEVLVQRAQSAEVAVVATARDLLRAVLAPLQAALVAQEIYGQAL